MQRHSIPNDILRSAYSTFLPKGNKGSSVHAIAFQAFMSMIEDGALSLAGARKMLADPKIVSDYIDDIKAHVEENQRKENHLISLANQKLLEKTHANSEKALTSQDAMRAEFKTLFDELHGHVQDIKLVAAENVRTAADIHAATKDNKAATEAIKAVIPKIATDSAAAAKAARWKSSIVTALIVSPIGVLTGYLGNKFTNLADKVVVPVEQHDVMTAPPVTPAVNTPPPSSSDPLPVKLGTYGLYNPETGYSMLDLLEAGRTVTLPTNLGNICLWLSPPFVLAPSSVQPPKHPHRHHAAKTKHHHVPHGKIAANQHTP